jgi:hypothetical protein
MIIGTRGTASATAVGVNALFRVAANCGANAASGNTQASCTAVGSSAASNKLRHKLHSSWILALR